MNVIQIFYRFLLLGCISFGGPAAHIGYFQKAFVDKLAWLSQDHYAKLVALSQFLPGPGSSQVGFAIGLHRAGLMGGLAAFLGFTLPSFALMLVLAFGVANSEWGGSIEGAINGLKLLAVVVVADAIISMFKSFCQQWQTMVIAAVATVVLIWQPSLMVQMAVLILAGIIGVLIAFKAPQTTEGNNALGNNTLSQPPIRVNWAILGGFLTLFIALPLLVDLSPVLKLFNDFYNAGSLVFGGGHVVLPLLQHSAGEALSHDQFITGYAAAQAVPGPMFTLATYLGAQIGAQSSMGSVMGAALATLAIFLPGFLLVLALKDGWQAMLERPKIAGATLGINAAVVGLLAAAFYQPVFSSAITGWQSLAACCAGLLILRLLKCPIFILVAVFVLLGYWL